MATRNGAEIMGLGSITGSIKPGKKADLVIADLNKPHLSPIYDIYSHITYCMRPGDIDTVFVNGKIVLENRKLKTLDEAEVMAKSVAWQDKIKNQ